MIFVVEVVSHVFVPLFSAEIVKETCSEEVGRQLVRYRHQQSNVYICFNKKGAVKAVVSY